MGRPLPSLIFSALVAALGLVPVTASAHILAPPRHQAAAPAGSMDPACIAVLDGFGGIHCGVGEAAPHLSGYWPGWEIARAFAVFPDGLGGFVLDGFGGVHGFGNAPDNVHQAGYWAGWDIARAVALAPWSSAASPDGWVLDGFGGIHPFGGAPEIPGPYDYWSGWDIARSLVIIPDSTPTSVNGFVMDGFGGLHGFGLAAPTTSSTAYWPGWDIAKQVVLTKDSTATLNGVSGLVLDGWGGLHAVGSATLASATDYWPGWNIARGMTLSPAATHASVAGWTLDAFGGLHAFGSPPAIPAHDYWPGWDIARGSAGAGSGSGTRKPPPPPPPTPRPTRLYISNDRMQANAAIYPVGWAADGSMQNPPSADSLGWEQNWVIPGDAGNALLDGHRDWYGVPQAVFYFLYKLQPGDEIFVERADRSILRFRVDWSKDYPWTAQPSELYVNYGTPSISLITCSGPFDGNRYPTRLVVHASLV